jgi:N-acetylmuramoyl-L-alanine amidase
MEINTDYLLSNENYIEVESIKKQIIIGNTNNHDMKHYIGWVNRHNGKYKKTAAFTIDAAGVVYKHFDPKFQSEYFEELELNNKSIVILLENDGWLTKDIKKNVFLSWLGYIYKEQDVFEKRWRNHMYWAPYNEVQMQSAANLVKELCNEFYIPLTAMAHNTKVNDLDDYNGILYKSNLHIYYTDLTPAFDYEGFINNLEQK